MTNDLNRIELALIAFADEVPPLFFRLKGLVEALHEEDQISAGGRAVLRDLVTLGAKSVPDLAAMRSITRQGMQPVIDDLAQAGLITLQPNPRHKRSPLWAATQQGEDAYKTMRQREVDALRDLAREFTHSEVEASLNAIRFMSKALAGHFPERLS